ncbi:MAG: hypothetical protein RL572_46, partial [Pseudomonadota bacterium]
MSRQGTQILGMLLSLLAPALAAQDAAVLRTPAMPVTVHPAVALEQRIVAHIDALGITGEQEPPFRTAMQQVAQLEAGQGAGLSREALLEAIVERVARVLYPTQVAAFR